MSPLPCIVVCFHRRADAVYVVRILHGVQQWPWMTKSTRGCNQVQGATATLAFTATLGILESVSY